MILALFLTFETPSVITRSPSFIPDITETFPKFLLPISGYLLAVLIHFMWNLSVSFEATFLFGLLFLLLMIVLFFIIFIMSLAHEKKIILRELSNEEDISLILPDHIEILSSLKRNRKGWIKEEFRKEYSKIAIKYAFRKHQLSNSEGITKATCPSSAKCSWLPVVKLPFSL